MSTYKTITLIGKVLSVKSNHDSLKTILQEEDIDWEQLVKIGSKHLILPTFYLKLANKQLTHLIPEDLESYLKTITDLNYERNYKLLKEIKHLSALLKNNNIDHVFIKGAALLASNYFEDIAERMLGDIDILVASNQLEEAFSLIKNKGYSSLKPTLRASYFEHKHLPRLVPVKYVGAIEIHKKLLRTKSSKFLSSKTVLVNGIKTENIINRPRNIDLLKHVIYNNQLDDDGFYFGSFNLRSFYDAICILRKDPDTIVLLNDKYKAKFISYASIFFEDIEDTHSLKSSLQKKWLIIRINYRFLSQLQYKILQFFKFINIIISRASLFIIDSNYRKDIFKDRKRIFSLLGILKTKNY